MVHQQHSLQILLENQVCKCNGKAYPATGKGAVKLIKEDGTIDTTQAPFAEGSSFEIKVSATGYKDELSFTYEKPVVIDTKALESAIEKQIQSKRQITQQTAGKPSHRCFQVQKQY